MLTKHLLGTYPLLPPLIPDELAQARRCTQMDVEWRRAGRRAGPERKQHPFLPHLCAPLGTRSQKHRSHRQLWRLWGTCCGAMRTLTGERMGTADLKPRARDPTRELWDPGCVLSQL